jgi:hypothetical protein
VEPRGSTWLKPNYRSFAPPRHDQRSPPDGGHRRPRRRPQGLPRVRVRSITRSATRASRSPTTGSLPGTGTSRSSIRTTSAYRPASRAINYRTEPFFNRLEKAPHPESLSYNSYTIRRPG